LVRASPYRDPTQKILYDNYMTVRSNLAYLREPSTSSWGILDAPSKLIRIALWEDTQMAMTMAQASAAMRDAMRETVKRYSTWYLLEGVLMIVAGLLALVYPYIASVTLVFLLGWILIISGVFQGIGLIGAGEVPHFWWQLLSVVLAIVIGVLLLRNPDAGLLVMTVLLIVYFIVEGISKVIFALNIRPFTGWGWLLASGIVGILLGAYLWANMPISSEWVLGVLLGIQLIVEGAALAFLAWMVRSA
jgi:uncharacterized membrane protein HdeD (DUF308 family)